MNIKLTDEEDLAAKNEVPDKEEADIVDIYLKPILNFLSQYMVPIVLICYFGYLIAALIIDSKRALTLVWITLAVGIYQLWLL